MGLVKLMPDDDGEFVCLICQFYYKKDFASKKEVCQSCAGVSVYDWVRQALSPVDESDIEIENEIYTHTPTRLQMINHTAIRNLRISYGIAIDEICYHGEYKNPTKYNKTHCEISYDEST